MSEHKIDADFMFDNDTVVAVADDDQKPDAAMSQVRPLSEISGLDGYLRSFGRILGKKAVTALDPLHVPSRDALPDMDDLLREPFEAQAHVIAAVKRMIDENNSGFVVGEMGVGKTLLAMCAVYLHAKQTSGGTFRSLVLCPDHLIAKWKREIEETIPDAIVYHFGPLCEEDKSDRKKDDGKTGQRPAMADLLKLLDRGNRHKWEKPAGPEYYVIGRNQIKWFPEWAGISDPYTGFNGTIATAPGVAKTIIVDRVYEKDELGNLIANDRGDHKIVNVTAKVFSCPCCGTVLRDKKGVPVSHESLSANKATCTARYLQQVATIDRKSQSGLDRISPMPSKYADRSVGTMVSIGSNKYVVKTCGEPLWWFTSKPYRFNLGRIIQKKFKRFFKYLIIDECHEMKSDETGQSMAASKLIGAANHTLALTGTIIGGYAHEMFSLLMRINGETLRREGYEWGKDLAFSKDYGRIDRIVKTKEDDVGSTVSKSIVSSRRAKGGKSTERLAVRPGIMPTLLGHHMLGSTVFLTLDEMAEGLPAMFEYIGGDVPEPPEKPTKPAELPQYEDDLDTYERMKAFWVDTACTMEPDQQREYNRVEGTLDFAAKELLKRGSMKLLGTMLSVTMGYPDYCHSDWTINEDYLKSLKKADVETMLAVERAGPQHTVGYWNLPRSKDVRNWIGVVTPKKLADSVVYPKEQALLDICKLHKAAGHQVWVYVQMSDKRNVMPRLKSIIERHDMTVGIMRSKDVGPKEREAWIAANGRRYDVMICFPKLVSTGLDLFSKVQGGHNYNCIVFYQTGYKLNDMRQAARRSWRIGQPRDCYIYYLYYKDTMQHRAMSLMSKKMAAAQALEGEFSEDGLAAMAGEENLAMAMARSMSESIDDADMQRSWTKVKSGGKKRAREGLAAMTPSVKPSPLDKFAPEVQLVGETMVELASKPSAADPADIEALAKMFHEVDGGMWAAARQMADRVKVAPVEAAPVAKTGWYKKAEPVARAAKAKPESWSSYVNSVIREELGLAGGKPKVTLKVHVPEPAPEPVAAVVPSPGEFVFDESAIAAMFANLAANGMTLADLSS